MSPSYGKRSEEPALSKLTASFWPYNTQCWQVHSRVWCSWAPTARKRYLQRAAAALWLGGFSSLPADSLAAVVFSCPKDGSLKPLACSKLQPAQEPAGGLYRNRKHKRIRHVLYFLFQLPLKPRSLSLKNSSAWFHILKKESHLKSFITQSSTPPRASLLCAEVSVFSEAIPTTNNDH